MCGARERAGQPVSLSHFSVPCCLPCVPCSMPSFNVCSKSKVCPPSRPPRLACRPRPSPHHLHAATEPVWDTQTQAHTGRREVGRVGPNEWQA